MPKETEKKVKVNAPPAPEAEVEETVTTEAEIKADPTEEEAGPDEVMIGSNKFAAAEKVGPNEVTLGYLVRTAAEDGGYSAAQWNNLSQDNRDERIQKILDKLRKAQEKKSSTSEDDGDTTPEAKDVRVHDGRALGGSYVSLGGGERRRVAERSGGPVPPEDEPVEEEAA